MELHLLLSMGRLDELRVQLYPPDEKDREHMPDDLNSRMGAGTYERYAFLLAAAEGNYEEADGMLEQARDKTLKDPAQLQKFRQKLAWSG
jgi:hypothetical protein